MNLYVILLSFLLEGHSCTGSSGLFTSDARIRAVIKALKTHGE